MATLAEIRAKLQESENRRTGMNLKGKSSDNQVYPFWDIPDGSSVNLRFLPDANKDNTFFWVEKQVMKFPFAGVLGGDEKKQVFVQVPCVEMWGDTCPVHVELRPWFKQNDKQLEDLARVYWKKKTYILQGFVRNNPLKEEATPENPIRRFQMTPQVFNIVKAILMDTEVNDLPTDYDRGIDFILSKGRKANYADYTTSKYSRSSSALSQTERDAIEKYGLLNLSDFLPKRPTAEEVNAIYEMFQASIDGQLYDPTRWGKFYKPRGVEIEGQSSGEDNSTSAPAAQPQPKAEPVSVEKPVQQKQEEPVSQGGGKSTQDILAMIRNRNKQ